MFELSINNIVTLSRGDSFECPLFLNEGTDVCPVRHTLLKVEEDGEIVKQEYVIFALLRPNQCFENAVVKKRFDTANLNENGDVVISFDSKDTINLCPGNYFYEIKAFLFNTEKNEETGEIEIIGELVNTVTEKTKFIII